MSLVRGTHEEAGRARKPAAAPARRRDHSGAPLSKEDFRVAVTRGNIAEVMAFLEKGMCVRINLQSDIFFPMWCDQAKSV